MNRTRLVSSSSAVALGSVALLFVLGGCNLFMPREPEDPVRGGGTYTQPDTPDLVVENIQNAIAEMNVQNYRRSLASDMAFRPTATAGAESPLFSGWSVADEERYFSTMAASADQTAEHELRITDATLSPRSQSEYVLDGVYLLRVNHTRSEVPREVQGRLVWVIVQDQDGLWRLQEWTDQELSASVPTWSTLKAAFS